MNRSSCACTIAAIVALSAPAIANAHIHLVGNRSHIGKSHRVHSGMRRDNRLRVRTERYSGGAPSGVEPLQGEDRDRGVYLGQRHDD